MKITGRNTKECIFLVAAELFAERGYNNVSVRHITEKIGIKQASIYNHYTSKREILDDLLRYYLNRMEPFYQKLAFTEIGDKGGNADLEEILDKLMLSYDEEEKLLMYQLTRIVHHEQFNHRSAAEALIGEGYRKYVAAHIVFFDRLAGKGFISGQNTRFYGELYARLSLTFATQFLHPEIVPTMEKQTELSSFVNKLVISYEQSLLNKE